MDDRRTWAFWIGTLAGGFLGVVLIVAALAKVIDPVAFMELIELEGLDFLLPSWVVAPLALALEAGLGLALLLGVRRLRILVPTTLLVLFLVGLTLRAYIAHVQGHADPAASCGCFGNLVERSPSEAFWTDLALLLPALALSFLGRPRHIPHLRARLEFVGAFVLLVLAFGWKAPDLPLDDFATRLKPDVLIHDLCAGQERRRLCLDQILPQLEQGRHLLVIAKLDDDELRNAVPRLNELTDAQADIDVLLTANADLEEINRFRWELGPIFDIREAPPELLRPLYRTTPRTALIEDGRVIKTYSGVPAVGQFLFADPADQPVEDASDRE